ncbi:MAG: L-serine ammonia-lyase, iron-sulfur-dependent, subunit alpha [Bacilli bacterium]
MESIKSLFVIGPGPSSSHTIGPFNAALDFKKGLDEKYKIKVILYGSLALTGKGHLTDKIIKKVFEGYDINIDFNFTNLELKHPNTLSFTAYLNDSIVKEKTYYSVGGGEIVTSLNYKQDKGVYDFKNFNDIKKYLQENNKSLVDIVNDNEDKDINEYLTKVLHTMFNVIERNLSLEGFLPGQLNTKRVASKIYENALKIKDIEEQRIMLLTAFAYATAEGNASGDIVVTAPTCGSAGILPSILYYESLYNKISEEKLINALKIAGIIGDICKQNASISGAVLGCQAEVGVATAMTAGALSFIHDLSIYQIEYSSEVALEHFLGLTCDPVDGYVQIPCIERNGIGSLRAYVSYLYAKNIAPYRKNRVSFDDVVEAMQITGESLSKDYKETAIGGLAKIIK